jgi:predicted transcriptional regulator YheO
MAQSDPLLKELARIAQAIAATFPDCEVVVHDLKRSPRSSIIAIYGKVTGRKVGDGIRDLISILKSSEFRKDMLTGYISTTTDGKILKSTTVVIRDPNSHEIASAFCINYDLGSFLSARKVVDDFVQGVDLKKTLRTDDDSTAMGDEERGILDILEQVINRTIKADGRPVSGLSKEDKVRIVGFLDDQKVFCFKGAINMVAERLKVSKYTIYNYLEEARASNGRTG